MKVIKVGRGYENDEVLNDSTVSRNHLEIFFGDDRLVVVTDLNSANGTTVNGKKINEPTKLDSLDILKAISKNVDIIESGMAFSTPIADGGDIQTSAHRAIKAGINLNETFKIIKKFKKTKYPRPVILMGYWNLILQFNENKFIKMC